MTQEEYRKMIPDPTPETEFFLAQDERPRAVDTAVYRLLRGVLLSQAPLPEVQHGQGGVVPGHGQWDAVQLHDQLQARAGIRGGSALRYRGHRTGRGTANDGQHRRHRKHAGKPGAGHAAQGDVYRRHRIHSHPQLGTGVAGTPHSKGAIENVTSLQDGHSRSF